MPPGPVTPDCAVIMGLEPPVVDLYPTATDNYAALSESSTTASPGVAAIKVLAPIDIVVRPFSVVELDSLVTVVAYVDGKGSGYQNGLPAGPATDSLDDLAFIHNVKNTVPLRVNGVVHDGVALDVQAYKQMPVDRLRLRIRNAGSSTVAVPRGDVVCTLAPATLAHVAMIPIGVSTTSAAWLRLGAASYTRTFYDPNPTL